MAEQLTHDTPNSLTPQPCRRCGIKYSRHTAYIPCFEKGDTLTTWQERHQDTLDACPPGTINEILRSKEKPRTCGGCGAESGQDHDRRCNGLWS